MQKEYDRGGSMYGWRIGFPSNSVRELRVGPDDGKDNGSSAAEWAMASVYASGDFAIKNRYLFGTIFRRDGTSKC